MANFTTHMVVGTVVAGTLGTLTFAADVVAPENVVAVTLAGVAGSILPDIDLQQSRAARAMFSGLAIFLSFALLFSLVADYSVVELWILWLGSLAFIRYGLYSLFHRLSVHRGNWHSIVAAILISAATAILFKHILKRPDGVAWLAAGFMFLGYLTHLILDEMYSVDITGTRLKASFGTALKFYDGRYPTAAVAMAAVTMLVVFASPSPKMFVDGISSRDMWVQLHQRMWPQETWFGLIPTAASQVASQSNGEATGSGLTTGSLPDTSKDAASQ
jgi:membrane-bound metal-dependent hydrolase YbcI (DUF457 family)